MSESIPQSVPADRIVSLRDARGKLTRIGMIDVLAHGGSVIYSPPAYQEKDKDGKLRVDAHNQPIMIYPQPLHIVRLDQVPSEAQLASDSGDTSAMSAAKTTNDAAIKKLQDENASLVKENARLALADSKKA